MKFLSAFVLFLLSVGAFAQKAEVRNVVTHNRTTVICDASTGEKTFPAWGVFPAADVPVRKITMHVTLGSPDSLLTAHWDYLDHIFLRRKGGAKAENLDLELGRMLTPYGSIFGKGWSWDWQVDVTDFAPMLRDSCEIEYLHSGYEAPTVGWSLTINFEITVGQPILEPRGMAKLWNGSFRYGDPSLRFEDQVKPIDLKTGADTQLARIRIQHTGHGMDTPRGCSEFCSRWRQIKFDGNLVDFRSMWKDCGENPLYPQGGTWVYDRAYWCPGDLQQPDFIDVPVKSGNHTVALEMEPYVATENIQANESMSAYVFFYGSPAQKNDVAVERIMVPSDEDQWFRLNPAVFNPRFIIRNQGAENLKSLVVTYGTEGFKSKTFTWKGDLPFNQTTEVEIPGTIDMNDGKNRFTVTVSKPNGKKDAWSFDNQRTSTFNSPKKLPTTFVLELLTNNRPKDNTVSVTGENSDTVYIRRPESLEATTLYRDTIRLKEGLYELCLKDTAGDGLEFWAEPTRGFGHLRLFDLEGRLIHIVESDCGNGETLAFRAANDFETDTINSLHAFSLYPRLTKQNTELNIASNKKCDITVKIRVDDQLYEQHEYRAIQSGTYSYNLSNFPDGRIIMEIWVDGTRTRTFRLHKTPNRW